MITDVTTGQPVENFATRRTQPATNDGIAAAAFRLGNPVRATVELLTRPRFQPEPEFDLSERLKEVPALADNHRRAFAGTVSNVEFDYRKAKLEQELKDQQTREAAGLPGLLWDMAAGIASPTTLVPIVGMAGRIVTAGRLGRAAGATAGASVAVDEAALRAANLSRTDFETAMAVTSAAILGATLGGLSGALSQSARARALREIGETIANPDRTLSPEEAVEAVRSLGIGAAVPGEIRFVGGVELPAAGRAIAQMSPTALPGVRAQQRPSNSAMVLASTQQQLSTGGLRVSTRPDADSTLGMLEAVAPGGQLEGRSRAKERFHDKQIVDIVTGAFLKHEGRKFSGPFKYLRGEAATMMSGIRRQPGKMNFQEFNEELFRALNMGDESPVPEVAEAAAAIRKQIIAPITEAAQRAGLLPEELKQEMLKGSKSYLMRVYDHDMLARDPMKFVHMVVEHNREVMQARWQEKLAKLREQNAADQLRLEDRLREADEAKKLQEEIKAEIAGMSDGPQARTVEDYAAKIRDANKLRKEAQMWDGKISGLKRDTQEGLDEAREMTRLRDELRAEAQKLRDEAKKLKEDRPEIDEFLKAKKALEGRKTTLNRTLDKLIGEQAKAVDAADRIVRQSQDELVSFGRTSQELLAKLDATDDAQLDAIAADMRKGVEKLEEMLQKGEEQLGRLAEKFPELVDAPAEWQGRVQRFKENVFDLEVYPRGDKGEKLLKIDGEASQKAALDAIDAVLDEGELKVKGETIPLKIVKDNPGGNWLAGKQAKAEASMNDPTTSNEARNGITGSITATIPEVYLPVKDIAALPGLNNEMPAPGQIKYDDLMAAVKKDGWDPQQKKNKIVIAVNHRGNAFILEGNNRLKVAGDIGVKDVRVEVRYWNGGETATTNFNAENFSRKYGTADVDFQSLTPTMRKSLEDWRGKIASLKWSDHLALRRAEESFDRKMATQLSRQERQDKLAAKLEAFEGLDRDAMRQTLVTQLEDAADRVRDRVSKRALREAKLREKAQRVGAKDIPEWFAENDRLAGAAETRTRALRDEGRTKGVDDFDLETGEIRFDDSLNRAAHDLKNKILGTFVRTPGIDLVGEKGPALARMLDIPFDKVFTLNGEQFSMKDFLMRDVSRVMRSYVRSLVPDTEIAQRFNDNPAVSKILGDGTTSGKYVEAFNLDMERIANDLDWDGTPLAQPRTAEQKQKLSAELRSEYEYGQRALRTLLSRLRHTDGIPENPAGAWARSARTWRAAQVPLYMGNVLFASLPELMVPVMKFGLTDTFRDGWSALVGDYKSWSAAAGEAARAGQGLDTALSTRLMAFADMQETNIRETRFEQMVDFFAQKTGTVAMFDAWTAFTKNMAAPVVMGRFMRALETVVGGNSVIDRKIALDTLAQAGVNENLARRLWEQTLKHGSERTQSGFLMPRTEAWDDLDAIDTLRGHLSTMLDITTVTPGLERPMWTTASEPARIITQFRSFGFSATSKMMLAGMQQRDIAVVQAYLGMLALGVASYGAWAAQYGPGSKQWDDFTNASWEKVADEAIYRSGILAAFQDVQALLSDFDVTHGLVNFSDTGAERLRGRDFRETLLGVSMSTASKMQTVLGGIDDPTQSTTNAMKQLMPYNNVWYLRALLNEAKGNADEMFGIPEDRR